MISKVTQQQNALRQRIDSASSVQALLSFLECVDMNVLKQFAHSIINTLDPKATSSVYHRAMSINEVLSDDAMQHVLSFLPSNRNRTVCKSWNQLLRQNETKTLRNPYQSVKDSDLSTKTYIVHPKRDRMHKIEIERGFEGIYNDLEKLLITISSNDRSSATVLIHSGNYQFFESNMDESFVPVPSNTHFIGIGPRVTWKMENNIVLEMRSGYYQFENVQFVGSALSTFHEAKLTLKKCRFTAQTGSCMGLAAESSSLIVDSCHFMNSFIHIPSTDVVTVKNTTFSGIEQWENELIGCIDVLQCQRLIVENNTFENIECFPVFHDKSWTHASVSEYVLKGNRLKDSPKCKYDPNVLYKEQ